MLRKFFASFLSFLFVIIFTPFLFSVAIYSTFTDKDFYQGDFVDLAHRLIIIEAPKQMDYGEFNFLKEEDVARFVEKIADKEALRQMVVDIFDQFSTSSVEEGRIKFRIDLSWLIAKKQIIKSEITDIFYERLPKCDERVEEFPEDFSCVPKQFPRIDFEAYIGQMMDNKFFINVPGEYVFYLTVPDNFDGTLADFFGNISGIAFTSTALLLLVLLIMIGFLIFKPIWLVIKWEAKTLFFASLTSSLFFGFLLFVPNIFELLYDKILIDFPKENFDLMQEIFKLFIGSVSLDLIYWTLPLLILSLIFWLFARSRNT